MDYDVNKSETRLGVDKVKPKGWFKYFLSIGLDLVGGWVWWVGLLAPKISGSSPEILKMVHQVRLMMFLLKMVGYSMSYLLLST